MGVGYNMQSINLCISVIIQTLLLFSPIRIIGLILIPFISAAMNIYVNQLFEKETENILKCIIFNSLFNYVTWIVQQDILFCQARIMHNKLLLKLNISKLQCGACLPGINQKNYQDLIDDSSKLSDFLVVVPILWSTMINFSINIYMIKETSNFPVRSLYTILCLFLCGLLTWLTDPSLYERTKPSDTSITKFNDSQYVKMKISMGCNLDKKFEKNKQKKRRTQHKYQKYAIILLDIVTTYISLYNKNIGQLHSFRSFSWMIGCLSDNIKSLQYYTYMIEFISLLKCMNYHKLDCENNTIPIGRMDEVSFCNASFGYYSDDLIKNPSFIQKITNLSYTFKKGIIYYLEAPNGVGKSTILRMFLSNLSNGDVYFGSINRKNLSFTDIYNSVFHVVQASEYTPKFSKKEINAFKNKDIWLEEKLGLKDLFDKDTVEMSGGQKKRMLLYILMTSSTPILLLDEILSELSTENIPEVPEGGGWLTRVVNTLIEWPNRQYKIIILVGHGLRSLIPNNETILQLSIKNNDDKTILSVCD